MLDVAVHLARSCGGKKSMDVRVEIAVAMVGKNSVFHGVKHKDFGAEVL
jgi:hypothetical protein